MATARFMEILRCNGVDQEAAPHTAMVVPFNGENQVVLETAGMDLRVQSTPVNVQEFNGYDLTIQMLQGIQEELRKPGVDPQQRDAFMPSTGWQKPRFFRILGTIKTGFPGTTVNLVPRTGGTAGATLQVAVVDQMVVKVAIRNVRARDAQGHMRFHAKRPCDPATEVARMNAIWRPQTNVVFELVASTDVEVDATNPKTAEELKGAYGIKTPPSFAPESTVWADKLSPWFAKHRVPGTHMTFFVVHKLLSGGNPDNGRGGEFPNGTMNRALGVGFIADSRLPSTFAHEAGHYVGDMSHLGSDIKLLMRGDGSGYKIPFDLAGKMREALAKRKVL